MKALGEIGAIRRAAEGGAAAEPGTGLSVSGVAKRDVGFAGDVQAGIPALPEPSPELARAVSDAMDVHPDIARNRDHVTRAVHEGARVRLRLTEMRLRDATGADWIAFLAPLCNPRILANPPAVRELPRYAEDFMAAIGPVPAAAMTVAAQRDQMAGEFFPRAAGVKRAITSPT